MARSPDAGGSSAYGPVLDPIADKVFMAAAVGVVAFSGRLAPYEIVGVLLRDIVATVAFVATFFSNQPRAIPARWSGKAVTVAQILTLVAFLLNSPYLRPDRLGHYGHRRLRHLGLPACGPPCSAAGGALSAGDQAGCPHLAGGAAIRRRCAGGPVNDDRWRQCRRSRSDADPSSRPLLRAAGRTWWSSFRRCGWSCASFGSM